MRILALLGLLALPLAGCTTFPQVNASVDPARRNAPYPDLVPISTLTARMTDTNITPDMQPDLHRRAERLKRRAAALKRRSVVDDETRARMASGIAQ